MQEREHVGINDAMDIEGLIWNAYATPWTTKYVEEGAVAVKKHDVAKARNEDMEFVQVWENIQMAVNMVDEVGKEPEFVLEDGREPTQVAINEGSGMGLCTGDTSGGLSDGGAKEAVDLRDYWALLEACILLYTRNWCTLSNYNIVDESMHNAWMHKLICGWIVLIAPQLHTPEQQLLAKQHVPCKYIHQKGGTYLQKHIHMWKGVRVVQRCAWEGIHLFKM